ncbi:TetR/AcrR family transcriptional regulator [Streptomyces hyaluromycini]|uniref:TetR/AcrR family transcriptional regulator n=1 Tax=Streptomyces hyaluromycini TaxID=1377993 RepID=A0ABV1WYA3_9ACTN
MTSRPAQLPPRGQDPHITDTGTGTHAHAHPRAHPRAHTRARILEAALRELGRSPDCTLADIAEAAGVARRTVYVHFAGRAALVRGLAAEAAEAVRLASEVADVPAPDAATALAHFVLTLWPAADRYRVLVNLARQDLGAHHVDEVLAPARTAVARILAQGQRQGLFHTTLPPGPLTRALEAYLLSLLDAVNAGAWADDVTATATTAATTALIAAGVDSNLATTTVRHLHDHLGPTHSPR